LPFSPKSFDLVFTIQALEQMEAIREEVLSNIASASAGYVAMFEPFADWNSSLGRRAKIKMSNYFAARIDDLPSYGLLPVFATDDMPMKVNYGVGLVVASVSSAPTRDSHPRSGVS
jgi:hypothetical protein